jgi:ABC-type cobalamin/Fe3+-siderophores transport system ATPase subunit
MTTPPLPSLTAESVPRRLATSPARLPTMGLIQLRVEGLFGEFTHEIKLNDEERLSLVHGPNGVGKTTLLRIVDAFFNKKYQILRRIPFSTIIVTLTDGDRMQVTRKTAADSSLHQVSRSILEFISLPLHGRSQTWVFRTGRESEVPPSMMEEYIQELTRISAREWLDSSSGETMDFEQVLDKYSDRLPIVNHPTQKVPEWLAEFTNRVPVFFIEAQRLQTYASARGPRLRLHREGSLQVPTVTVHAEELAETIKRTLANYGDRSQILDSTFPTRLLERGDKPPIIESQAEIRDRYVQQGELRNRYVRAGLLDAGDVLTLPDRELDDSERRVLGTYMDDVEKKLNVLEDLADKLELFLSIVNGKFRRKTLTVDREHGFRILIPDGGHLELASLSSGEQQEIVLAYGLLFREKPGTLILLDEPELSLHVSWQLDLIPDLLKIAELTDLHFLVATHSPQVIGERWDLTVELTDEV